MTKAFVQNHTAKTQFFLLSNEKKKRSKYHLTENVGIQGKEKKFKRSEQKIFIKIIVTIDNWILEALAFTENEKGFLRPILGITFENRPHFTIGTLLFRV